MSMHTPGPWVADDKHYSDCVVVVDQRGFQIVEATHMPILLDYEKKLGIAHWGDMPGVSHLELSLEEQAANARLIAAAPELLDELIKARAKLYAFMRLSGFDNRKRTPLLASIDAVIAKAKGEA